MHFQDSIYAQPRGFACYVLISFTRVSHKLYEKLWVYEPYVLINRPRNSHKIYENSWVCVCYVLIKFI